MNLTQMKNTVLAVLATAGSAVAQALGGWDVALKVLICFMALDYVTDGPAIVAAFQQAYGIDLTRARLHWWRFKALMSNLPEETQLVKIIGFRTADLAQFQGEERERRAELKERFALPVALRKGGGRIVTLQDRNEAFAARFRR